MRQCRNRAETKNTLTRAVDRSKKQGLAAVLRCGLALSFALLAGLLHATACPADTILFDTGERLSGKLVRIEGGRVTFTSEIAGKISTDLARVTSLTTDQAVEIGLDNGTILRGSAFGCRQGHLYVQAGEAPLAANRGAPLPRLKYPVRNKPFWSGSISAGLTSTHGNSFSQSANIAFKTVWRAEKHRLRLSGRYLTSREEVDDDACGGNKKTRKTTEENFKVGAKYDYFFKKKLYTYLSGTYEKDHIADLDYRILVGSGLGYQWKEEDLFKFSTDAGLALRREQFTTREWDTVLTSVNLDTGEKTYAEVSRSRETRDTSMALQLGWELEWKLNSKLALQISGTLNPSLDDFSDYYLTNDAELRVSLTPLMYTSFKMLFDYDATPGAGTHTTDTKYIMGLGISF